MSILFVGADYEVEPEFLFKAFRAGTIEEPDKHRWEGDGDPFKAFEDMLRDLIVNKRSPLMWTSSMTHLVMDGPGLGYSERKFEVDGTVYRIDEFLVPWDEDKEEPREGAC